MSSTSAGNHSSIHSDHLRCLGQVQVQSLLLWLSLDLVLHLLVHRPAGEQVGVVSSYEAGLDVEDGHVPPAGGVVVDGGRDRRTRGAGFVLHQLQEGLHVRAQPGHNTCPHCCHRLVITGLQGLQQSAVISTRQMHRRRQRGWRRNRFGPRTRESTRTLTLAPQEPGTICDLFL